MSGLYRILDANANRAREALRVMEEAARFLLDDVELTEAFKALRHDLAQAMRSIGGLDETARMGHRDTPGDVGTRISLPGEMARESAWDVATAAGKRLSEALRAIEEYGKTVDPALAAAAEAMRYRGYELEKRLCLMLGSGRGRQWKLCVLLTESLCRGGDWLGVARAAVEGGADCLQLREKELPTSELLRRARALVGMCRASGVSVVINDRLDVALTAGADGVHLGQEDLPCAEARKIAGRRLLIGVSTGNLGQARKAVADGADYCGVGPMFSTTTKKKDFIAGPEYLRAFLANFPGAGVAHLAIGGVGSHNVMEVVAAGARGVAVSSAVCGADDPRAVAESLVRAVERGA
ncbi:MAG: thiamine phosphate synthase [Phycisphaeraceae bacterium]|nr:thiamine phosphate synthase [Phycisphaeraceae bacterium]